MLRRRFSIGVRRENHNLCRWRKKLPLAACAPGFGFVPTEPAGDRREPKTGKNA